MKTKIIIKEENREKIEAALEAAQKRARVRRITADDVFSWKQRIERKFWGVANYRLKGTTVWINKYAQRFARAYHGIPQSTWFAVKKVKAGWALVDVSRDICTETVSRVVDLPDLAKEGILRQYTEI